MNWKEDIKEEIEKELSLNTLSNKAFGVKIILHHATCHSAVRETVYYNKGFRFQCFVKWNWYFRYRTALIQVKNPKFCVELVTFDYEQKPKSDEIKKRRKDIISARRRKVTMAKNKLADYAQSYTGLFPITEDSNYIKAIQTVIKYEERLNEAEKENYVPHII